MRTVLVTGPIGSGKSEACRYLASLDFPVYECDARTKLLYSMEVSRYVEIRAEVKVETRNVPARVDLAVLPSTATAVFRCAFPTASDPSVHTHFYVDYREFANSRSGRCMAHCEGLPSDVIDYTLTPEVFDCMVRTAD